MIDPQDSVRTKIDDEGDKASLALFAAIVVRYNVNSADLIKEIEGAGTLARIARDLLGWPLPTKRKRGRPSQSGANWALYLTVSSALQSGSTVDVAISELVKRNGGDPEDKEFARLKKNYQRAVKKWGSRKEGDRIRLADFYGRAPDAIGDP